MDTSSTASPSSRPQSDRSRPSQDLHRFPKENRRSQIPVHDPERDRIEYEVALLHPFSKGSRCGSSRSHGLVGPKHDCPGLCCGTSQQGPWLRHSAKLLWPSRQIQQLQAKSEVKSPARVAKTSIHEVQTAKHHVATEHQASARACIHARAASNRMCPYVD